MLDLQQQSPLYGNTQIKTWILSFNLFCKSWLSFYLGQAHLKKNKQAIYQYMHKWKKACLFSYRCLNWTFIPSCSASAPRLSVHWQLDVVLRLVLQQLRHPYGFVPVAKHSLFDAGGVNLTDEALQRLQAAAEDRSVAQAKTGQPTAEVLVCAVDLGVGERKRRVLLDLVVVSMMEVELHVGRSGWTCWQHLRCVTVAGLVVPERGEVLPHRLLLLRRGAAQGGAAGSLQPSTHISVVPPIWQLWGGWWREAGFGRLANAGICCSVPLSVVSTVHPHCSVLVGLLHRSFWLPHSEIPPLQVSTFCRIWALCGGNRPSKRQTALGRHA